MSVLICRARVQKPWYLTMGSRFELIDIGKLNRGSQRVKLMPELPRSSEEK